MRAESAANRRRQPRRRPRMLEPLAAIRGRPRRPRTRHRRQQTQQQQTDADRPSEATRGRTSHARTAGHHRQPHRTTGRTGGPRRARGPHTSHASGVSRHKKEARRPRKDSRPPARAVCEALVSGPRVYGDRVQTIARNQTQVIAADIRHLRQQVSGWS